MAFSRTVLRSESVLGRNPASTLRGANRLIVEGNRSGLLLTAFYATLDTGSGRLAYANGGHNWPLWLRVDSGKARWLAAPGFLLGAFADFELEEGAIDVAPGDLLAFYTDGVTEARSPGGGLFGEERLQAVVEAQAGASAQQLVDAIVAEVDAFAGDRPQADDLTLFVVKRQR
jgi:sigma-B regulation protein RsbU (phosphoserine phosphatase)